MRRKALDRTLWLIIAAVVAIFVLYLMMMIIGKSFGLFHSEVQSGTKQSSEALSNALSEIAKLLCGGKC